MSGMPRRGQGAQSKEHRENGTERRAGRRARNLATRIGNIGDVRDELTFMFSTALDLMCTAWSKEQGAKSDKDRARSKAPGGVRGNLEASCQWSVVTGKRLGGRLKA